MSVIITEIFNDEVISQKDTHLLVEKLKKSSIKRGEYLLKANDEVNDIFYVHSGCLRSFIIGKDGKEHILQFAVNGWWISDYISLYGKIKTSSVSYIECIKDATIYRISKKDFDDICNQLPWVGRFYIRKMELAFASFQNRILESLTLSAKQRYLNFINTYPSISNDVKNYHIASFLGITTESLSRIRKEISSF